MTDIEREIEANAVTLELSAEAFHRVGSLEAAEVIRNARERFVAGNPRSWWMSLKVQPRCYAYPDSEGYRHLGEHWTSASEKCWLIPETEEPQLPVYSTELKVVARLLAECSFFEYYLLSVDQSLLLIENDHNEIIVASLP